MTQFNNSKPYVVTYVVNRFSGNIQGKKDYVGKLPIRGVKHF